MIGRSISFVAPRRLGALLIHFLVGTTAAQTALAQGSWTPAAPMPTARGGIAGAVAPNGTIYALGGMRSGSPADRWMDVVEAYDPVANSWSAKASMPVGTDSFAGAIGADGLIYTFGGIITTFTITNNAFAYDPVANSWAAIPSMPEVRYSHAGASGRDGRIYAIGGTSDGFVPLSTVVAYDPGTGNWTELAPLSVPRYYSSATRGADGRIYVFGGSNNSSFLNDVEIYDPISDMWSSGAPMPTARSGSAAAELGGLIYIIGGQVDLAGTITNIVEAYDPVANSWTTVAPMLNVRAGSGASASGGKIFAYGGGNGSVALDTVEAYSPELSDTTPPTITISSPTSTSYLLNQYVAASFLATDFGSGIASILGTVANGASIDTSTAGTKTFTVAAIDNAGNSASKTVSYTVGFNINPLYDQTRAVKRHAPYPIKIQLLDANGANVSSAAISVHAVSVTLASNSAPGALESTGNANPDNDFRYDASLGGYIFNLSTSGLHTGTWNLNFKAGNDPMVHTVQFQVK